jgi:hypothetical protein
MPRKKVFLIRFAGKVFAMLNAAADDVLQCSGCLPAIASRSGEAGGHRCGLFRACFYIESSSIIINLSPSSLLFKTNQLN